MSNFIEREAAETGVLNCAAYVAERIASADGHAAAIAEVTWRMAANGELDLAAGLADTIQDPHGRDVALAQIAGMCADFNDDEYGFQLVEAISEHSFQQQGWQNIAVRQARAARFDDALQTAEQTDDPFLIRADAAIRLNLAGDGARAREVLGTIELPTLRAQVLNEFAAAEIKRGASPATVLEEFSAEIEKIEFGEEKSQFLLELAARCLENDKPDQAAKILEDTRALADTLDERFRDQVLAQAAILYARGGDAARAEATLEPVADLHRVAQTHLEFALEHYAKKDHEQSSVHLNEAYSVLKSQSPREIRDSQARFNLLSAIAVGFANTGNAERGIEIALENPEEKSRFDALSQIAAVCAAQNQPQLSAQALNAIDDLSVKVLALVSTGAVEARAGNAEKADQLLNQAAQLCEEVEQLAVRSQTLNRIAAQFVERGDNAAANNYLSQSLNFAAQILNPNLQVAALADIDRTFADLKLELSDADYETLKSIVRRKSW